MPNKKRGGGLSPLTVLIRVLIIVIFLVAIAITVMRIAEVNQNDRKTKELSGYLKRYAAMVSSGAKGATLN